MVLQGCPAFSRTKRLPPMRDASATLGDFNKTPLPDVWEGYFEDTVILGANFRPTGKSSVGVRGGISCIEVDRLGNCSTNSYVSQSMQYMEGYIYGSMERMARGSAALEHGSETGQEPSRSSIE